MSGIARLGRVKGHRHAVALQRRLVRIYSKNGGATLNICGENGNQGFARAPCESYCWLSRPNGQQQVIAL